MTTLHIRVEKDADMSDLRDVFAAIDRGEAPGPRDPVISVESLETLGEILRPTNLAVLESVAKHEPESIRALARHLDRGAANVLSNVNELEEIGLLRIERNGQSKRPVVWYDEIDVDIPIRPDAGADEAPADD